MSYPYFTSSMNFFLNFLFRPSFWRSSSNYLSSSFIIFVSFFCKSFLFSIFTLLYSSSFLYSFFTSCLIQSRSPFLIGSLWSKMMPYVLRAYKRIAKFLETCLQNLLMFNFSKLATTSHIFSSITIFCANLTLVNGRLPVYATLSLV